MGHIKKSTHEVGVVLNPEAKKGLFAKFECALGIITEVGVPQKNQGPPFYEAKTGGGDAIISPITPVNQMTSSFTQVYSSSTNVRRTLKIFRTNSKANR